jgi:hypothetical protein
MSNKELHRKKAAGGAKPKGVGRNQPPDHPRRSDEGTAFLPDPYDGRRAPARVGEPLAERLAEEFVASATSAEETTEDDRDEVRPEELGGPFTESTAGEEFATDPDDSNPIGAAREPFPTATRRPS